MRCVICRDNHLPPKGLTDPVWFGIVEAMHCDQKLCFLRGLTDPVWFGIVEA